LTKGDRVRILSLVGVSEWGSVQMLADCLFDYMTGNGYEVMVFA
jgi:hypothetical protein